jgi:chemotaxis protein methyltransferase CheR
VTIGTAAFDWVRSVVLVEAGIVIEPGKEYLIESRLTPLARAAGASDVNVYVDQLRSSPLARVKQTLVEALTTNETSWFRDGSPYLLFEKSILPQLRTTRAAERKVRVWSAACSTGQEPYSLAMILEETLVREGWRAEIFASDIDETVLAKARSGTYSQLEINRGLPAARLVQSFTRQGVGWQINPALRSMVTFHRVNLSESLPPAGQFDVIFLRNVLIYFSIDTRRDILTRIRRMCRPDGFLVLGGAETTLGVDEQWERVAGGATTCYRPLAA